MLEKYTIVQTINDSHKVYLVQSVQDNRFYVKKILDYYDKNVYTWLSNHYVAGIPSIKEIKEENNQLIIIEEYISGKTLESILKEREKLSEEEVKKIAIAVLTILKNITAEIPLVHRDIKPSNIIIKDNGELFLIDFNTAKIIYEEKSRDTILLGTEGYAAPEQYGFAPSNIQTDIYAIGVMMNELLTGSIDLNNNCCSKLTPIIKKCTMMDPKTRYNDYKTLIKQIEYGSIDYKRQYLPIGFRKGNPISIVFGIIWYLMIFFMSSGLTVENTYGIHLFIDRFGFMLTLIFVTFFSGNYLECQKLFGINKIQNKLLKFFAVIFADFVIFITTLFLTILIDITI